MWQRWESYEELNNDQVVAAVIENYGEETMNEDSDGEEGEPSSVHGAEARPNSNKNFVYQEILCR